MRPCLRSLSTRRHSASSLPISASSSSTVTSRPPRVVKDDRSASSEPPNDGGRGFCNGFVRMVGGLRTMSLTRGIGCLTGDGTGCMPSWAGAIEFPLRRASAGEAGAVVPASLGMLAADRNKCLGADISTPPACSVIRRFLRGGCACPFARGVTGGASLALPLPFLPA